MRVFSLFERGRIIERGLCPLSLRIPLITGRPRGAKGEKKILPLFLPPLLTEGDEEYQTGAREKT